MLLSANLILAATLSVSAKPVVFSGSLKVEPPVLELRANQDGLYKYIDEVSLKPILKSSVCDAVYESPAPSGSCLVSFVRMPKGLIFDFKTRNFVGEISNADDDEIEYRIDLSSGVGSSNKIMEVASGVKKIEIMDPPIPSVNIVSQYEFRNGLYLVPKGEAYLGDAVIKSERGDLDIHIPSNPNSENERFSPPRAGVSAYRRIVSPEMPVWGESSGKIRVSYSKAPQIAYESEFKVVSVPSYKIRPVVDVSKDSAVDSQPLPVRVSIRDQYSQGDGYNPEVMGKWKVKLVRLMPYNKTEDISDYIEAKDGQADFLVDLSSFDEPTIRISSEAVLDAPIEGYERKVVSVRPVFVNILRGGEIEGDVLARRVSGEAPLVGVFKLSLKNKNDARATGAVVWEVKAGENGGWEVFEPKDRYKFQYVRSFGVGTYKVRAKVFNVNSGLYKYTSETDVVVYEKPSIKVLGPRTVFVGGQGKYSAELTIDGKPISPDRATVEWSVDGGKTYSTSGAELTLSRDSEDRINVWARVRTVESPVDDADAYRISKLLVEFRKVKPPRPYITGPTVIESGKTYTFNAYTSLPYKGMDTKVSGEFLLPDGSVVQGEQADYIPVDEDLEKGRVEVKFVAWIDGFREKGAEASHSLKSRVWKYVWPNFGMEIRKDAGVAPASIVATIRPIGFNGKLESPSYEWHLPEGAIIKDDKQGVLRSFILNESGNYSVSVTVRDSRGNESEVEQKIEIGKAAPYKIDLQYSGSNAESREPLDVLLRSYISGGHPRDRVLTRTYSVEGSQLSGSGNYARATLNAGEHRVKLGIVSEMGHKAEGELTINVNKNSLPSCSLRSRETVGSWIVYADCEDADGRMKSYEWTIAGEFRSISSDRVTISKGPNKTMPTISLVGVDDSGGKSEAVTMN
ncbi:hypothetical protein [Aeromonas dhakensis]|uniref:hypothetical protein n=1 Tax=Aeromonas dhakensis TaxID=196024 RepID=UPI001177E94D|nr:hypothetical protein [Aeromonas dhakensis]